MSEMDTAAWQRAKVLMADALERPPAERDAFLRSQCSDADLLQQILELLRHADPASPFLEPPQDARDALSPGTELGPYTIVDLLGRGGMGEVYRARDVRLGRDVAIKVLPGAFAKDPDRVARFEREARAVAALSHPNVLAVFDTGVYLSHPFVVTELLEGQTLTERLAGGALPVRKAIDWGAQIARGLAAAHGKGVTHRDIKPDNVFITTDGLAKILDFGLAQTMAPTTAGTVTALPITDAGMVIGTVGYMSPEQVRGEPIDPRSDLFSFGAVLYEMLTGQRAFRRDTPAETMTAILREEPPDVSAVRAQVGAAIDRIVNHCLEKIPAERFQSARDVAFALDSLSGSGATQTGGMAIAAAVRSGRVRERIAWAAVAVALAAALIARVWAPGFQDAAPPYLATIPLPVGITLPADAPAGRRIAMSPDGRHLAFVGSATGQRNKLWLQALDEPSAKPAEGSDGAQGPFWSADSRFVAFRVGDQLMKASIAGGAATIIGPTRGSGTWNAADVILAGDESDKLLGGDIRIISRTGGEPSPLLTALPSEILLFPTFLPDGQHFLFTAGRSSSDAGLYVGRLGSNERPQLYRARVEIDHGNVFYASGYLVAVRDQNVVAVRFDLKRMALGTDWTSLGGPVEIDPMAGGSAAFSVSQTGVLVYQPSSASSSSRLVWFDRHGAQLSVLGDEADFSNLELSPDGSQLLVSIPDPVAQAGDIWIVETTRGGRTRMTIDASDERSAVWSTDGSSVVYTSKGLDLYTKPLGSSDEKPFLVDGVSKDPRGFSPDGRFFLYRASGRTTGSDLWVRPMEKGGKPHALLNSPFNENAAMFSPDGRWLAYSSDESGRNEVYVTSFPSGAGKWRISTDGGTFPRWRRDGKEMFYLSRDGHMMSVAVKGAGAAFTSANAEELFQTNLAHRPGPPYDVSADGERFVINTRLASNAPPSLTVVVNWPQIAVRK